MEAPEPTPTDAPSGLPWTSRDASIAAFVFVFALALRSLHLAQVAANDPFYELPAVDGAVYDAWARSLLEGGPLDEGVPFMGPGYPLFMAAVYAIFGPSIAVLKGVQAVLGAATAVAVAGLARSLFRDRRVALLAGLVASTYAMLIFYGATVMVVNVQVPLIVGFAWLWVEGLRRPTIPRFLACGLVLGLSAVARQTTMLLAPCVALWLLLCDRPVLSGGRRLALIAVFTLAFAAPILPFTVRNWIVADDFVVLSAMGGPNFYMGNRRGADGTWQPPDLGTGGRIDNPRAMRDAFTEVAEQAKGRSLAASEVSSIWLGQGLREIAKDPGAWLALELRKLGLFFNAYEVWGNRSIEVSRDFSWVLRLPLPGFGLVVPLGLVGLALAWRDWRRMIPILAGLAVYLAGSLLFFVLSRYRMPAVVLLMPPAAFATVRLADQARAGALRKAAAPALAVIVLMVLVRVPLTSENRLSMAYYNLANKYRDLERYDEAVVAYVASLSENPGAISTHNNLAVTLERAGRLDEAVEAWRRVGTIAAQQGDEERLARARRHVEALGAGAAGAGLPDEADD